jgi:hypothetical protein
MDNTYKTVRFLVIATVLLGLIFLGGWLFQKNSLSSMIAEDNYQAVFLENGDVYFGKVTNPDQKFLTLTNIYYLELDRPLQKQTITKLEAMQPKLKLIKLGNELHGPIDQMSINTDKILFIENLKFDSKVVEAITDYESKTN